MASGAAAGQKGRSVKATIAALRGIRFRIVPDQVVVSETFAAAQLTGANSGFFVFVAPAKMQFLGLDIIWTVAGTNTFRVKKVKAAATSAAGAAADTNNVDLTAATALTTAANTVVSVEPANGTDSILEAGDKVAIASAAGTASLAGAKAVLRLAFL
jgi:hypothetical protein